MPPTMVDSFHKESTPVTQAERPFHILVKPIGPICNIDCAYCFYLKKEELYPETKNFRMNLEVLENHVRQYIESQPRSFNEANFAWQGGEPTLMGVDFFRKAVEFQKKYARPGMQIANALQTNGTLLNDEWGEFLHKEKFLLGLSIDGPRRLHDEFRVDRRGRSTFDKVMQGLEILKKHEVDFNTLTVLQRSNSHFAAEIYDFLTEIGSTFLQFIPIVEHENGITGERSVEPEQFGNFMNEIFDRWIERDDVGKIFIQHFDMLLGLVMGHPSSLCVHAETCGRALALEHNGDLYSCDHFVNPEDRIGNIQLKQYGEMIDGPQQTKFGLDKRDALPRFCRECEFLNYCHGACPKDRILLTPDGEEGLQYLCAGYKLFYAHTEPIFKRMAQCIRMGRPARDFNKPWTARPAQPRYAQQVFKPSMPGGIARRVGRNDPCPCGSGLKYKKCCMSAG